MVTYGHAAAARLTREEVLLAYGFESTQEAIDFGKLCFQGRRGLGTPNPAADAEKLALDSELERAFL